MVNIELEKYISNALRNGTPMEQIKQDLLKGGWNIDDIEAVLLPLSAAPMRREVSSIPTPPSPVAVPPTNTTQGKHHWFLISLIIILGVVAAFWFIGQKQLSTVKGSAVTAQEDMWVIPSNQLEEFKKTHQIDMSKVVEIPGGIMVPRSAVQVQISNQSQGAIATTSIIVPSTSSTIKTTTQAKYNDSTYGYTVSYPKGWFISKKPNGNEVAFGPTKEIAAKAIGNIVVSVGDFKDFGRPPNLEQMVAYNVGAYRSYGGTLTSSQKTTVGGVPAYLTDIGFSPGSGKLFEGGQVPAMHMIEFVKGTRLYGLIYMYPAGSPIYIDVFNSMLNSFAF